MVNAGRILIMSKGTWDSTVSYVQLDLVAYNGVAYLARQASVGVNPSTDASMTYWQPFGSASQIATTTTPGLVMPDDNTIKIAADGTISIPIDGATLKIDSVSGMLYADVVSALSALSDVNVSSASNGQTLIYNSSTQKWENSNIAANTVVYSNTQSGLAATNAQAAIDEVEGRVDTAESGIGSLQSAMTAAQGDIDDLEAGNAVTTLSVNLTGWTSDTTSQSGTTLYKKQISVNNVYVESPTVDIGSSGVLPTVAEQESYNLLQYCTVDDAGPCLYLYASAIPTTAFYINVTGVD